MGNYLIGDDYKSAFNDLDFIFIIVITFNTNGLQAIHLGMLLIHLLDDMKIIYINKWKVYI